MIVETALPAMRERGWGRIVNVASSSVREPIAGLALSNAHRMATVGLFKTLADEVAADGVTVNTVATGRFATDRLRSNYGSLERAEEVAREQVPARRLGTPDEYGDLVAFICSERAAYLTGAVIPLDGGLLRERQPCPRPAIGFGQWEGRSTPRAPRSQAGATRARPRTPTAS